MSAREWQPGDVAMVKPRGDGDEAVAIRLRTAWFCSFDDGHEHPDSDGSRIDVRPLVVIDPENREQVERLAIAYTLRHNYSGTPWQDREQHNRDFVIDSLTAALADFANPIVKPDEPTGLGAVVEDADGVRWYLLAPHIADRRWACWDEQYGDRDYDEINAVRILSTGVES